MSDDGDAILMCPKCYDKFHRSWGCEGCLSPLLSTGSGYEGYCERCGYNTGDMTAPHPSHARFLVSVGLILLGFAILFILLLYGGV